jgi:hypothetical protein
MEITGSKPEVFCKANSEFIKTRFQKIIREIICPHNKNGYFLVKGRVIKK